MRKRNLLAVVILFAMLLSGCRLYNVDEIKQHDGLMLVRRSYQAFPRVEITI